MIRARYRDATDSAIATVSSGSFIPDSGIIQSVTILDIRRSGTDSTVAPYALAGSVDVVLRTEAPSSAVTVSVDSTQACAGVTDDSGLFTCTVVTAAFDTATGRPQWPNGAHQLVAESYAADESLSATATMRVVFINADTTMVRVSAAGTYTDSAGATWWTGDLTATALPVLYSDSALADATFAIHATRADGSTTSVAQMDSTAADGFSAMFSVAKPDSAGGTENLKDAAARITVSTVRVAGDPGPTGGSDSFAYWGKTGG